MWKNFCHHRWRRVNVRVHSSRRGASRGGSGGGRYQAAYASLNGWRDPRRRLRRTILSTAPGSSAVSCHCSISVGRHACRDHLTSLKGNVQQHHLVYRNIEELQVVAGTRLVAETLVEIVGAQIDFSRIVQAHLYIGAQVLRFSGGSLSLSPLAQTRFVAAKSPGRPARYSSGSGGGRRRRTCKQWLLR